MTIEEARKRNDGLTHVLTNVLLSARWPRLPNRFFFSRRSVRRLERTARTDVDLLKLKIYIKRKRNMWRINQEIKTTLGAYQEIPMRQRISFVLEMVPV